MMLHKVTQDLLLLGREAGSQLWFLPDGIEQRVPGLPCSYLLTQRPERYLIGQDTAPPPVDVQNGRLFAQTMVTMSPEVPSPCTLPIQSGHGATSTVSTSARFMSHTWMRSPSVRS